MFKNSLIVLSFVLLFSGCNSSNNESELQAELNTAKAMWNQQDINDYQITTQRSCLCIVKGDVVNIVEQGQMSSAFYAGNGRNLTTEELAEQKTIDEFFAVIQQAIDVEASSLVVSYHATFGYPTQISIDYDQLVADDEIYYQLFDLKTDTTNIEKPQLEVQLVLKDRFGQQVSTFVQGEEISFILTLTNNGSGNALLNYSDSQQYDFYIESSSEIIIWRWSDGRGFTQALTELTIAAEETVEVSQVWDQKLSNDENIPAGIYTAIGSFLEHTSEATSDFAIQ